MSDAAPFNWVSSSCTDVGMVRQINEDACLELPELGLWVVADGMGGHSAGDVASSMIVDTLGEQAAPTSLSEFVTRVEETLLEVNTRLRDIAAKKETSTVGSTVAALITYGAHGVCLWAGDSRVYRLRDLRLERVSQDHALVEELVERGVLTREQAATHPQANLVTRAVGATDVLYVDMEIFELRHGDVFVLCSDGLDKEVEEDEIAEVLMRENDQSLSDTLVDLALSRGSRDNVTVIAVEIQAPGRDDVPRLESNDERIDDDATLPSEAVTAPATAS